MNKETWKKMHVKLVKYHVYQQLKIVEYKANPNMTIDRWNILYGDWNSFLSIFCHQSYFVYCMTLS